MRTCLVSQEYPPETGWGGIGTYTRHLALGLAGGGHGVHVVSRLAAGARAVATDGAVHLLRVAPRRLPLPGRRILGRSLACLEYSMAVSRALARLPAIDVVEFPNWNAEGLWHLMLGRRRSRVITRVHSPYAAVLASREERLTADKRLAVALERAAVVRSDVVVTHSEYNATTAARLYGIDRALIPVIPHGIPVPPPPPFPRPPGDLPRVLYVGRLERRKGIHVLMEAIPHILDADARALIVIAGQDFPSAPGNLTWQQHARTVLPEHHRRRVRFLGHVDDAMIDYLYATCEVLVAPSLYESFGLVYLEAMARGLAVIGSRAAAIPEVVADGETGVLVPPGDPDALARAIVDLLRDAGKRAEMGRLGHERVKRMFDVQTMVDRVLDLYAHAVLRSR
jgi:glycosyltransferase involved in cell wall biosynthesis